MALVSGKLTHESEGTNDNMMQLSDEQRVKLAEAVMFMIRRRAAVDEFVPTLVEIMLYGTLERLGQQQESASSSQTEGRLCQATLIQQETQQYFLRSDCEQAELEVESIKERWQEQDIRLKTGGPVFQAEEADVVRAARISVLAELVGIGKASVMAPYCALLVRLCVDALRLETSRPVTRAASLLAREIYGSLVYEQQDVVEALQDSQHSRSDIRIPMAVALVNSDEALLVAVLKYVVAGVGENKKRRLYDPATEVRCKEALQLREQVEKGGIMAAARLIVLDRDQSPQIFRVLPKKAIKIDRGDIAG